MKILHDEDTPEGFERLPSPVASDALHVVYLAVSREKSLDTGSRPPEVVANRAIPPPGTVLHLDPLELAAMEERLRVHEEGVWANDLPALVERLLTCALADLAQLPRVNDLFQTALEEIVSHIGSSFELSDSRLYVLELLFGKSEYALSTSSPKDAHFPRLCCWYYNHYGKGGDDAKHLPPGYCDVEGVFAKVPQGAGTKVSALYVSNINYFGILKGFDVFLSRISNSSGLPLASLSQVYRYISLMKLWHRIARRRFTGVYYQLLRTSVVYRLENLTTGDLDECQAELLHEGKNGREGMLVFRILADIEALVKSAVGSSLHWEGAGGSYLLLIWQLHL